MGLNTIKLTPQLVADLYPDVLVESNTTVMPGKDGLKFLGKNGRNILVVVSKPDAAYLPDGELNFLTTVLTACGLGIADIAIINWTRIPDKNYQSVIEHLESRIVLLFDVKPVAFGLPVDFPHYQVQPFDNRTYVFAPALSLIESAVDQKKQLWLAIKKIFAI
jgi:hypothetical protein